MLSCVNQSDGLETGVLIKESHLENNVAVESGGKGGAIGLIGNQTILTISSSKFEANSAHETGGAISAVNITELHIDAQTVFSKNAAQIGGAVFVQVLDTVCICVLSPFIGWSHLCSSLLC